MDKVWIGTIWRDDDSDLTLTDAEDIRQLMFKLNCIPIFIEKNINDAHYLNYCKQMLWPLLHNVDQLDVVG